LCSFAWLYKKSGVSRFQPIGKPYKLRFADGPKALEQGFFAARLKSARAVRRMGAG